MYKICINPENPSDIACLLCQNEDGCTAKHLLGCSAFGEWFSLETLPKPLEAQTLGRRVMGILLGKANLPIRLPKIWKTRWTSSPTFQVPRNNSEDK